MMMSMVAIWSMVWSMVWSIVWSTALSRDPFVMLFHLRGDAVPCEAFVHELASTFAHCGARFAVVEDMADCRRQRFGISVRHDAGTGIRYVIGEPDLRRNDHRHLRRHRLEDDVAEVLREGRQHERG